MGSVQSRGYSKAKNIFERVSVGCLSSCLGPMINLIPNVRYHLQGGTRAERMWSDVYFLFQIHFLCLHTFTIPFYWGVKNLYAETKCIKLNQLYNLKNSWPQLLLPYIVVIDWISFGTLIAFVHSSDYWLFFLGFFTVGAQVESAVTLWRVKDDQYWWWMCERKNSSLLYRAGYYQ